MAESRVKCINAGCANMIQPATAKRNDGVCGNCYQLRAEAERLEYLRRNRKTVDLFEGVAEPTDILRIFHGSKPPNPLISYTPPSQSIEELYASLRPDQAETMMTYAAEQLVGRDRHAGEEIARHLAAFTSYNLDRMLDTWLSKKHFSPPIAFRAAGADICRHVLQRLEGRWMLSDCVLAAVAWIGGDEVVRAFADRALRAAAWIGSDEVVRAFMQFDETKPRWAASLHAKPSDYARHAGWEISDGKRRELSYPLCFAIVPTTAADASSAVQVLKQLDQTCTCCGNQLFSLLSFDATAGLLARLGLQPSRIDVVTCQYCTCYETIFARQNEPGAWQALEAPSKARREKREIAPSQWADIAVKLVGRRPHHAADPSLTTTFSQIGGLPMWVQNSEFPMCPVCNKTMMFLAQIDNAQFIHDEGVFYAFLCQQCRVTATTYQQT